MRDEREEYWDEEEDGLLDWNLGGVIAMILAAIILLMLLGEVGVPKV